MTYMRAEGQGTYSCTIHMHVAADTHELSPAALASARGISLVTSWVSAATHSFTSSSTFAISASLSPLWRLKSKRSLFWVTREPCTSLEHLSNLCAHSWT